MDVLRVAWGHLNIRLQTNIYEMEFSTMPATKYENHSILLLERRLYIIERFG